MSSVPERVELKTHTTDTTPSSSFSSPTLLLKRFFDLMIAVPVTIALLPLFAVIAIAIRLDSPGPVFFVQRRFGHLMTPFQIVKFRSLRHRAPDPGSRYEMLGEDPRITRVGRLIRNTSLDELPQLFNVITGSMSLVGPRPLVEWESHECLAKHADRFSVKPGITGLSQVTVRNSVDLDGRSDKDLEYVRDWSPLLDLWILAVTPIVVIRGTGIYPDGAQ